jgi:predicted dehydrogenase
MGERVRTAVIGTGFGSVHLGWLAACPEIQPCAIGYGSNQTKAKALAATYGVPDVTSDALRLVQTADLDLIVIAAPPHTHEPLAVAALARDIAVVSEKPLALTSAAAAAMVDAAVRSSATASVIFQWRENPVFQAAHDQALGGDLGEILLVDVVFHHDFLAGPDTPWPWRHDPRVAGTGALGDLGAHAFDLLRWITGREWSVTSSVVDTLPDRRDPAGQPVRAQTDDIAGCHLASGDEGPSARVLVSRVSTGHRRLEVTVIGTRGSLHASCDPTDGSGFIRSASGERHDHPPAEMNPYPRLLRALGGAAEPVPDFADGRAVQHLIDQAAG